MGYIYTWKPKICIMMIKNLIYRVCVVLNIIHAKSSNDRGWCVYRFTYVRAQLSFDKHTHKLYYAICLSSTVTDDRDAPDSIENSK